MTADGHDDDASPLGSTAEPAGWDAIGEWTDGIDPELVAALADVRALEAVYPLLHALVGRNLRDFLVRAAALQCVVAADNAWLDGADLDEALFWLDDRAREATLRSLRQSGWLAHDLSLGTTVTAAGRWAYEILVFLRRRLQDDELLPSVEGLRYALGIGMDPAQSLLAMRARLVALREEIEHAQTSHSEVVLRRAAAKLDQALELSARIREVLDRVALDDLVARGIVREIHELLSRLHGRSAELHRQITEVGRQYLQLSAGLTVEQIVRALMSKSAHELEAVGREALLPVYAPVPLLTPEAVAHAAEVQVERDRIERSDSAWEEAEAAPRIEEGVEIPPEVLAFLAELRDLANSDAPAPLTNVVPRTDRSTSFLRASLLALVGHSVSGEGVAGQLGTLALEVTTLGDGWPESVPDAVLTRLTPGTVAPTRNT